MRIGCGPQVLGKPGLHSYDGRQGQHAPHLSVSLVYLRAVLEYLAGQGITMYRMAANLAPYATHPDYPLLHNQVAECAAGLAELGAWVQTADLRVSFHAPATVVLASPQPGVVLAAQQELAVLAGVLNAMQLGPEAVVVVHVGGLSGGVDRALGRWLAAWEQLPTAIQQRIVLEHDHVSASLGMVLRIHAATGVPIVFDHLHWLLHNPEGWSLAEALGRALATWPAGIRAKVHFATPRTELRAQRKTAPGVRPRWVLSPPRPGHHSDFIHPWEFARFVETAATLGDFDVLLEAKASDVAVARLRTDLDRYVPDVAGWLATVQR